MQPLKLWLFGKNSAFYAGHIQDVPNNSQSHKNWCAAHGLELSVLTALSGIHNRGADEDAVYALDRFHHGRAQNAFVRTAG
jgi:hypothetical protein